MQKRSILGISCRALMVIAPLCLGAHGSNALADAPPVQPPPTAPKAPEGSHRVNITEKDNGKTVAAKKGDMVEVRLESNASTGFEWDVARNDATFLKPLGPTKFEVPKNEPPGAPGVQVFQFSVLKTGLARLELHYARPWEKGTAPASIFVVNLRID